MPCSALPSCPEDQYGVPLCSCAPVLLSKPVAELYLTPCIFYAQGKNEGPNHASCKKLSTCRPNKVRACQSKLQAQGSGSQGPCHRAGLNAASDSQPTPSCVCGGGFSRSTGQGFFSPTDDKSEMGVLVTPMSLAVILSRPSLVRSRGCSRGHRLQLPSS